MLLAVGIGGYVLVNTTGLWRRKASANPRSYRLRHVITLAQAKMELRTVGIVITHLADTDEYRVNFKGGKEATAYYTNDITDAVLTGRSMAQHGRK